MTRPLVSICLPNRNTRRYLEERIDSILAQTYTNWELVVSDNFSDDGAWEFFERVARNDPRVSIAQEPPKGMYRNWNRCIERAHGEFVYIATSDDGMAGDCLEKLVDALMSHPTCDAAHCTLSVIDENGAPVPGRWWLDGLFHQSVPRLADRTHVRAAPFDGLLCLIGEQVYYSITELMVRRSLFERIGAFESRWGSVGDFHWYMKLGLTANTVHVPDTWASWRVHASQATAAAELQSAGHDQKVEEMIDHALHACEPYLPPAVRTGLQTRWLAATRDLRAYYRGLKHRPRALDRRVFQGAQLFSSSAARGEVIRRALGRAKWPDVAPEAMRSWLESLGLTPIVSPAGL